MDFQFVVRHTDEPTASLEVALVEYTIRLACYRGEKLKRSRQLEALVKLKARVHGSLVQAGMVADGPW